LNAADILLLQKLLLNQAFNQFWQDNQTNETRVASTAPHTHQLTQQQHWFEQLFKTAEAVPATHGQLLYVYNDHLGTPQTLTDESGTVVWTATYDPFGKATINNDPDGNGNSVTYNVRFPGQYEDQETGLHYNYFRYYDPSLGRYLTADPIGLLGGMNLYMYAGSNPTRLVDMYGLDFREGVEDLWDAGPWDTYKSWKDAEEASKNSKGTGLPGPHNGQQDAYRHCVWSCMMASNSNQDDAREIGNNHEEAGSRGGQPPNEGIMDNLNNTVGRQCALLSPKNDPKSCPSKCLKKLKNGGLQSSPR
jgi:RHS repeat-associated protein